MSTMAWLEAGGGCVSKLTMKMAAKPTGTPNTALA